MTSRQLACAAMLLAAFTAAASCGGSPTSPTNLGGNWSGTWSFVVAGTTVTDDVTAALTQSGSSVTGTWTGRSGASGRLDFSTAGSSGSVSGTFSISQPFISGGTCSSSGTLSGASSSTKLELTIGALTSTSSCQWGASQAMTLTKN